ncbi:AMP-dependent synthetase like protein [Zymoseptoria brevis]|uniref:AMP-dependent synthetase like protein n=1 Tax=Zymoseptoria brevis TaxID=1047168 RepID=A0A0F4GT68_9PEZI|nr:AMP-dependent synthetase like protein [Zymoseptoria brevis]
MPKIAVSPDVAHDLAGISIPLDRYCTAPTAQNLHTMDAIPESSPPDLQEFLHFVRSRSSYFQELWANVAPGAPLSSYPPMDHESYWTIATSSCRERVLTGEHLDGIIYKSGGTTGTPKLSLYTQAEQMADVVYLAKFLRQSGVRQGDSVANLLYVGDLYGGFTGIAFALQFYPLGVHLPIGGHLPIETMLQRLIEHRPTVVVAIVTQLHRMASLIAGGHAPPLTHVRLLLYGGEAMYEDQFAEIRRAFPRASMKSLVYGSTEAGVMGFCADDNDRRVHIANEPAMILEIVDEDGHTILEPGREGRLLATNLTRRLMPTVRYPTGDSACWVDVKNRKFRLLGRDKVGVRLSLVSVDTIILREIVQSLGGSQGSRSLQIVIERAASKDRIRLRVTSLSMDKEQAELEISQALEKASTMYKEHVHDGVIAPLVVEICPLENFARSEHSGKVLEVVDDRMR